MEVRSFKNSQSIKSINIKHHKITFTFEDEMTVSMNAVGECCSYSYFKQVAGYDFQDLIGRKIVKFTSEGPFRSEKRNNYGDIRRFKGYKFLLDNDSDFKFFLINDSNGWYTGWIEINGEKITDSENSGDNISTLDDKDLPDISDEDRKESLIINDPNCPTTVFLSSDGSSGGYSGYTASSGGYTASSGGYTASSGGYTASSGGYSGSSGSTASTGGYTACTGGYTASTCGYSGSSGGYTASTGGYSGSSGGYSGSGGYTSYTASSGGYTASTGCSSASSGGYTASSGSTGYKWSSENTTSISDNITRESDHLNEYVIITKCHVESPKSKLNPNAKPFFPKGS